MSAAPERSSASSRAVTRVLDLLDALGDAPDGLALHELSRHTAMPKSSALRYLGALVERGYVERHPATGEYRLGVAVPSQAQFYARLARAAYPALERIAAEVDEMATFGVLDRNKISILEVVQCSHRVQIAGSVGDRDPLHCSALGKAVASTLPEDLLLQILAASGMPPRTPRTITDPEVLLDELGQVRGRGYALADQENDPGARAVAVPLPSARVHGALGVSGPTMRFTLRDAERVAAVLQAEARHIAASLDASPSRPAASFAGR